jgi:3-oxoacyl-[acyl-carrier protein] reductase
VGRSRELDGRVAIVTGAARGIGLATARLLSAAGAYVVLNDRDPAELELALGELSSAAIAISGDVTSEETASRLTESALGEWGRIDIVINNAGFNWNAPIVEMTDVQFTAMLDVHVIAPFRLLRAVAPELLRPRDSGEPYRKVVNMSSISGTMGNVNQANYASAKAALVGMTKALAREWGPHGVTVNAVAPGFIATRLTARRGEAGTIEVDGVSVELGVTGDRGGELTRSIALGRAGTAEDVADVVHFLSSPASDYVTGQVVSVNGGLMFGMTN